MQSDIHDGYTRISTIASAFAGYGTVPKHVLDRAAARGSCVHGLIFDHMNDISIPSERWDFMGTPLQGYFDSFLQFYDQYKDAEVLLQEERINDAKTMLTGEPDLLIKHEDKHILIDWKCSHAVGKHWQLQASGYDYLLKDRFPAPYEIYFVKLDKNGKPPVVTRFVENWVQFFAAYDLYREFMVDQKCNLEDE